MHTITLKAPVLKSSRDLMGRLVMIAAYRELELEYIFTHPLTLVPLTMCHFEEIIVTIRKGSVIELFEQKHDRFAKNSPENIEECEIDGQYLSCILLPSITIPHYYDGLGRSIS